MKTASSLLALFLPLAAQAAETQYAYQLPPATTVEIVKPVIIPANHSRALYQYGQPVNFKNMDLYEHHCWLETRKRESRLQTVAPGRARIMQVRRGSEDVDQLTDNVITRLQLRSTQQPALSAIQCEIWTDSATGFPRYITVGELLETFGGAIAIRPLKSDF